jgi:hypothetical protein
MDVEKKPVILSGTPGDIDSKEADFEAVLNSACERLWDKRVQYSIRRIREMEEELDNLDKELEQFLIV